MLQNMRRAHAPVLLLTLLLPGCAGTGALPAVSDPQLQQQALQALLTQTVEAAAARLARPDGYWTIPAARVPLPAELERIEKGMRRYGLERYADELVLSLNRAAEAAVPAMKPALLDAARQLTFADAAALVRGPHDAATRYFRAHSEAALAVQIRPAIATATARSGVLSAYKRLLRKATLVERNLDLAHLDLDAYLARAALAGFYAVMAEEEGRLRRDPLGRGGELLQRVFR